MMSAVLGVNLPRTLLVKPAVSATSLRTFSQSSRLSALTSVVKKPVKPAGISSFTSNLNRSFATHRDRGFEGFRGGRGRRQWYFAAWKNGQGWRQWNSRSGGFGSGGFNYRSMVKRAAVFTGAVVLVNWLVLPKVMDLPPLRTLKYRPDLLVYGLIGLNVAGFMLWKARGPAYRFISKYGLLQKDSSFNQWQMLGSAFSHQEFWHIGINMFVLYQFGIPMARAMGGDQFLAAYLDGAVFASFASIVLPMLARTFTAIPSLGASGAVFTIFGAFSYLVPNAKLALFFIPLPIGAWYVFLLTMAYNGAGLMWRFGISDYAGHLGGSMMGIIWGYILSEQQKKRREEQRRSLGWFA